MCPISGWCSLPSPGLMGCVGTKVWRPCPSEAMATGEGHEG